MSAQEPQRRSARRTGAQWPSRPCDVWADPDPGTPRRAKRQAYNKLCAGIRRSRPAFNRRRPRDGEYRAVRGGMDLIAIVVERVVVRGAILEAAGHGRSPRVSEGGCGIVAGQ